MFSIKQHHNNDVFSDYNFKINSYMELFSNNYDVIELLVKTLENITLYS